MNKIRSESNEIKSFLDDSLQKQLSLQAQVEKLLQNSFKANKEAGGMIYRSNNLNKKEEN